MLGTCENVMTQAIATPVTPVVVNRELEPYFFIPPNDALFEFGKGGLCSGSYTV